MTQNFAEKALEKAKKREKRRLAKPKKIFLEFIQERFDQHLAAMQEWIAIKELGKTYKYENEGTFNITQRDLKTIAKELGFYINIYGSDSEMDFPQFFYIAIPEYGADTELTVAQSMLKDFRSKLAKKVGEQEEMAIKMAEDIFEKINCGKFGYDTDETKGKWKFYFKVVPPCEEKEMSSYLTLKFDEIIQRAGFYCFEFHDNCTKVILFKKEMR